MNRNWVEVEVYKDGTIVQGGKIKKCSDNGHGYKTIIVYKRIFGVEHQKRYYVHRLVATAFLPNPKNLPEVNHINDKRDDNRLENLEWVTRSQNKHHKYRNHVPVPLAEYRKVLNLHYKEKRNMKDIGRITSLKLDMIREILEGKHNNKTKYSSVKEKGVGVLYGYNRLHFNRISPVRQPKRKGDS